MNPDPFEQQLQRRELPQLPPDWRAEILSAATAAREEQERAETPAGGLGWKHVRWGALAAVWVTILTLSQLELHEHRSNARPVTYEDVMRAVEERTRLMAEIRGDEAGGTLTAPPVDRQRSGHHRGVRSAHPQFA